MKKYIVVGIVFLLLVNALWAENYQVEKSNLDSVETIVPYELEYNMDSVLNNWLVSRMSFGDCVKGMGTIIFPDSVYINCLQKLPHEMEMSFNAPVRSSINFYAQKPGQVEYLLGMGHQYYFPIFESALSAHNIPLELKYLPVIESALNAKAISRVGAAGLWQFMVWTGRSYNLEINSLVDERMDPLKSTMAAAKYLKDLYGIYKDWFLVIAAYNCGPGNVSKAISRSGGKRSYWDIYPYLPRETRGYVPIFIAANYIMNYYEQHNICPRSISLPLATDTVMVNTRMHLKQISEVLHIPIEELRTLNPQYRRDLIPGNIKPYSLVLPFEQVTPFIENKDSILAYKADELISQQAVAKLAEYDYSTATYHKVRSGDTLSGIAKKYHVSVASLKRLNNISGTTIRIGQRLRVRM
ncbi:MAG: transglycosylase SLT domain-containing protein [Paludibacteraceae bacterium]|nr:transglycosylase SLT domain-containing protein [Paludibacteraceae bacterium]